VENIFYILTAYPDGHPAACSVEINGTALQSDAMGVTVFRATPDSQNLRLDIKARDASGRTGTWTHDETQYSRQYWHRGNDLLLRTDKAIYETGETLRVTIRSSLGPTAFFLDVLRNGQTVLTRTLRAGEDGQAQLTLKLPEELWGTLRLKAYVIGSDGRIDMETRVIHVRRAEELRIGATLDRDTFRPGATATAHLQVTDHRGAPAAAALSLAAVDEAVFYVCENQPGMFDKFFLGDGRLPLSGYRMAFAVSPAQLFSGEEQYQNLARALFSTSGQAMAWGKLYESRHNGFFPDSSDAIDYDLFSRQDHTLWAESYTEKLAQAEAFRDRYFRLPVTVLAITTLLTIPLIVLVVFAHTIFRLFRQMAAEAQGDTLSLTAAAIARRIYAFAFAVLLPAVMYLTALVLVALLSSRAARPWFHSDPRLLGTVMVLLLALATLGFPLFYRSATMAFRGVGVNALKVFALAIVGIGVTYWVVSAAGQTIVNVFAWRGHDILALSSVVLPIVLCVGLCWAAGASSRKPPGRFYTELGRSGRIVLVILLAQGLVLPAWVLSSTGPISIRRWIPYRSVHRYRDRLYIHSDITADTVYYGGYHGYGERMGGFGGYGGMAAGSYGYGARMAQRQPPAPRARRYFPETLLWQPQVITDETGRVDVNIVLADSITTWKMNIDAVSATGRLGNSTLDLRVLQDFFVDLDLPTVLTRGDEISIPVVCYNYLPEAQTVQLTLEPSTRYEAVGPTTQNARLDPRSAISVPFRIKATQVGTCELAVLARGTSLSDAVRRSIEIRPDGAPVEKLQDGVLSPSADLKFEIPPEAIPGSPRLLMRLYPSMFSEVIEGLESIFRMPHGCFEQTSSVTYPNVMALLYLRHTGQTTPEVEAKARGYIAAGYQRLLTFQVAGGGFDWFGKPPAGEKVTAYGILQLTDMSKVYDVDPNVVERACQWLSARQRADGSWEDADRQRAGEAPGTRVADTAYIAWALTEAGVQHPKLTDALEFLHQHLRETDSPHTIALAANVFLTRDPNDALGRKLLADLAAQMHGQGKAGFAHADGIGAMYARGQCFDIETTALSALAMMKVNRHAEMVHDALARLFEQKDRYGTWHSTHATVLAMKALLAGTAQTDTNDAPTDVNVFVNEQPAGSVEITAETHDLLRGLDLTSYVRPGDNRVRLVQDRGTGLPYRLVGTYSVPQTRPAAPSVKGLDITVRYDKTRLHVHEVLRCDVEVTHGGETPLNMAVIELALPPGCTVAPSAFERLVDSGVCAGWEMAAGYVVLYVRNVGAQKKLHFDFELRAMQPVHAHLPPSRVYEYYQPENECRTDPIELIVE
jgi:hypothetical protein